MWVVRNRVFYRVDRVEHVIFVLLLLSYLVGTFPSAELIARTKGIDIRRTGSGNPGASNVTRALGWRWGNLVMALDALKGALPTALGLLVADRKVAYAMLGAAVMGHMFPIWRHLRGGKGVATVGGGLLVLIPVGALAMLALWFVVSRATGKASLASLLLIVIAPFAVWFETGHLWEVGAAIALCAVVATRHVGNIRRLLGRREPSIRS